MSVFLIFYSFFEKMCQKVTYYWCRRITKNNKKMKNQIVQEEELYMKNKVIMTLLAVAVMSTATLSACGNKQTEETNTSAVSTETVIETETEALEEVTEESTEMVESTEVAELPEVPAEEPETEAVPAVVQTTMFAQRTANVRQQPSTDSEVLGTLSTNDPVIVNGDLSADGWYTVTYCDQTAYVKGSLLGTNTVAITTSKPASKTSSNKKNNTTATTNTSTNTNTENTASNEQAQASAPAETPAPAQAPVEQPAPTPAETPAQEQPANPTPSDNGGYDVFNADGSFNAPAVPPDLQ